MTKIHQPHNDVVAVTDTIGSAARVVPEMVPDAGRRGFLRLIGTGIALATAAACAPAGYDKNALAEGGADGSSGGGGGTIDPNATCPDQPDLIDQFRKLPVNNCTSCHATGKIGEPGWVADDGTHGPVALQHHFDTFLSKGAKDAPGGGSWVAEYAQGHVKKPDGSVHGGGPQELTPDQIKALTKFHDSASQVAPGSQVSLTVNQACNAGAFALDDKAFFEKVKFHSPDGVYAKFLRNVTGGVMPATAPGFKNNNALRSALMDATGYVGFYNWLVTKVNDFTQTKFYEGNNDAIDFLGTVFGVNWAQFDNDELARGPGNLMAYIVLNNRSIQEFITAHYLVAPGHKNPAQFGNPDEFWPGRLVAFDPNKDAQGKPHPVAPVSGLATDPLWQGRVGTSETNIGRHRAWEILRRFFNFDVLDIGSRNVVAPKTATLPTLTYPACVACHGTPMDHVAASFWDYQKNDGTYKHNPKLPADFPFIALNGHKIANDDPDRLGKMMSIIAADENPDIPFAKSMARMAFTMLMDRDPVKSPRLGVEDYDAKMKRFTVEDRFLTDMAQFLKANNYNFRALIVEMAMSPWFAANGETTGPLTPNEEVQLEFVGPGMISPEQLLMRLRQIFGNAVYDLGMVKLIMKDYVLDLGGIDSKAVTIRNSDPNAANTLMRLFVSQEADKMVQEDLAKTPQNRWLFKDLNFGNGPVEAPTKPLTNEPNPGVEQMYRATLARIHAYAFGRFYDPNSSEITAELKKWNDIWMLTLNNLPGPKMASTHVPKGTDGTDPTGVKRAWGAYMAGLIASMDFNS